MKSKTKLEFVKRAKVTNHDTGKFSRWRSTCYRYAVTRIDSSCGRPLRFLSMKGAYDRGNETIIDSHPTKAAAEFACDVDAGNRQPRPKRKRRTVVTSSKG